MNRTAHSSYNTSPREFMPKEPFKTENTEPNEQPAKDEKQLNPWLHAWQDSLANVKTTTLCLRLGDINSDGDSKLCICDIAEKKLRIFKGTSQIIDYSLLDVPVAMCLVYMEHNVPKIPSIAVAAASHVFIYRQLRPYKKWSCKSTLNVTYSLFINYLYTYYYIISYLMHFLLLYHFIIILKKILFTTYFLKFLCHIFLGPSLDISKEEEKIWSDFSNGVINAIATLRSLEELRDKVMNIKLTSRTLELLTLGN